MRGFRGRVDEVVNSFKNNGKHCSKSQCKHQRMISCLTRGVRGGERGGEQEQEGVPCSGAGTEIPGGKNLRS